WGGRAHGRPLSAARIGSGAVSTLVLKGGEDIDATGRRRADVVIGDGMVAAVGTGLDHAGARGAGCCVVCAGSVGRHVRLAETGREEAVTVWRGSGAGALGGHPAVVSMPNTEPAIDDAGAVREVQELARRALCDVEVAGAITVGRAGERLTPMAEMAGLGVRL